ncbi:hypothetical protein TELCIR_18377 [Teladorsagia circumcincta]|uniref:Uncharacterized protein n=1 Tax=Teladorsagia circumcincta TaxID=45464 RepID=A0A2G9TQ41_TELCI|nr:hypothetical protein TELCIR_18377 [Teladorsagia circumcincta]
MWYNGLLLDVADKGNNQDRPSLVDSQAVDSLHTLVAVEETENLVLNDTIWKMRIEKNFTLVMIPILLTNYIGAVFPKWGWFADIYLMLGKPYVYTYMVISWGSASIPEHPINGGSGRDDPYEHDREIRAGPYWVR